MSRLKRLRFLMIALWVVGVFVLVFQFMGLRVNLTASMPIGFYWRFHNAAIHRGDIVSLCLSKPIVLMGKRNGYIGNGPCPGNAMPLLKQVIALPGDRVALSSNFIRVNQVRYFAPQQKADHLGHRIIHWVKSGIYPHIKSLWVYGRNDPIHSWDSRYFGGVPIANITGVYRPLWVWRHVR